MGNREHCDVRHNGYAKTDTKPDIQGFSDFNSANNRILLIISLGMMLNLAT
jgi:hypothetical protein